MSAATRPADRAPVIEAVDLHRRYGDYHAVRGVSFAVRRGELFGLLGTNGAGKTSTLDLLEGLAAPDSGTARVLGMDPRRDARRVRPYQGIMLQEGGFPGDLTSQETLRMLAGTMSEPRPTDEALDMVDLRHRADTRGKSLSGGERRRLDLACALLGRPEILFLDEPTTGLDPESRHNTWELVRRMKDDGVTIVLTTHYLDEAERLADRLAIMHEGRIVREGSVEQIVADEPAVVEFRDPGMPFPVVGSIDRAGDRVVVRTHALQRDLATLVRWAEDHAVELRDLRCRSASLESVFLALSEESTPREPTPRAVSTTQEVTA